MQRVLRTEGASAPPIGTASVGLVTVACTGTVGLAAAGWIVTVQRMHGMDMGAATRLGSLPYFLSVWVPMMAAMMLPGTAPMVRRIALASRRMMDIPRYLGGYLAIWAVFGLAVYAAYRPIHQRPREPSTTKGGGRK